MRPLLETHPGYTGHFKSLIENMNVTVMDREREGKFFLLCITTYKRSWQIKLTLAWNVMAMFRYRRSAMICVADLNEDDEIQSFLAEHFSGAIKAGLVSVFRGPLDGWDASRAKNSIHFAAAIKMSEATLSNLFPELHARRHGPSIVTQHI